MRHGKKIAHRRFSTAHPHRASRIVCSLTCSVRASEYLQRKGHGQAVGSSDVAGVRVSVLPT
eukprot:scaffold171475_cov31-Tisochrysis_lutea.AAC.4